MCGFFTCRRSATFRETNWVPRTEVRGYHLSSLRDYENGMYPIAFSPTRPVPPRCSQMIPKPFTAIRCLTECHFLPQHWGKRVNFRLVLFFLSPAGSFCTSKPVMKTRTPSTPDSLNRFVSGHPKAFKTPCEFLPIQRNHRRIGKCPIRVRLARRAKQGTNLTNRTERWQSPNGSAILGNN